MSDPTLFDIDFKNKMAWVTQVESELPLIKFKKCYLLKWVSLASEWKLVRQFFLSLAYLALGISSRSSSRVHFFRVFGSGLISQISIWVKLKEIVQFGSF